MLLLLLIEIRKFFVLAKIEFLYRVSPGYRKFLRYARGLSHGGNSFQRNPSPWQKEMEERRGKGP